MYSNYGRSTQRHSVKKDICLYQSEINKNEVKSCFNLFKYLGKYLIQSHVIHTTSVWRSYLVDVVEFEVFQKQQQDGRDGLHDDLFVSIDINTKFHALQHCGPAESDITDQSPI